MGSAAAGGIALINSISNLSGLVGPSVIGLLRASGWHQALKGRRDGVVLATKFGFVRGSSNRAIDGSPSYIRRKRDRGRRPA
jgi:hypothetical protein